MGDSNIQSIEGLLGMGKAVRIKPQGYSMYPLIVPGRDSVIIESTEADGLKRGDVALYRRSSGILVIHRIFRHDADVFYFVGDNQTAVEGPIKAEQIIGVMTVLERNGRSISTDSIIYRAVCMIWLWMRPIRRPVSVTAAFLKKVLGFNIKLVRRWNGKKG